MKKMIHQKKMEANSIQAKGISPVIVFIAGLMLLCVSCNDIVYTEPEFPVERDAKWEIVSDVLYFNVVYDLFVYKSFILMVAYDNRTGTVLKVYDKGTGQLLKDMIHYGRGPGEVLSLAFNNVMIEGSNMVFHDFVKGSVITFPLDSLIESSTVSVAERALSVPAWCNYAATLEDNKVLYVMSQSPLYAKTDDMSRFRLVDENGKLLDEYDEASVQDAEKMYTLASVASRYAVSSERNKLAIGTFLGTVLEIYSVDDGIEHLATRYFAEPDFEYVPGSYDWNERTVLGFNDIFADEKCLFTSYDGEINPYYNDEERLTFTKIAVFDWNGSPRELISTDYRIEKLCYSESENTIYAAVADLDGIMYLAKMKL